MPRFLLDIPHRTRRLVSEVFNSVVASLDLPDPETRVCSYSVPVPEGTSAYDMAWVTLLMFRVANLAWAGDPTDRVLPDDQCGVWSVYPGRRIHRFPGDARIAG